MDKEKLNILITNLVTAVRAVGVVALIPVFKIYGGLATFLTNVVCFLSDSVDGMLARKLKSSTFFGSMFDGFTDKAFLIVNMIILASITPVAIVPILLEAAILGAGYTKYKDNKNIKSSITGKIKMWVAGITISLSYLLVDESLLNYMGNNLLNKVSEMNQNKLFSLVLTPLIVSEIATLGSYIRKDKDSEEEKTVEKIEEIEQINDTFKEVSLKEALFNHDYYEKYKDSNNLNNIVKLVRKKK